MKKLIAMMLSAAMLLCAWSGCSKPDQKQGSEQEAKQGGSSKPAVTVSEMGLASLGEYGKDYVSLYDKYGADTKISDVVEDGTTGSCYIERDGKRFELGLDFLSKAMLYNTEPAGDFKTEDEVHAEWWRFYIERWNRMLPELPSCCPNYYTSYNKLIGGVEENALNPYWDVTDALLYWTSAREDNSIELSGSPKNIRIISEDSEERDGLTYYSEHELARLVSELSVVSRTKDGGYTFNPTVVKTHEKSADENGNITYRITLNDDLYFSDGSEITAKDYLAMPMAMLSSVFTMIAFENRPFSCLMGAQEYNCYDGETGSKCFSGLKLEGDRSFSVTIAAENDMGYYNIAYLEPMCAYYSKAWLGNVEIHDDGEGCYLDSAFYKGRDGEFEKTEELELLCTDITDETLKRYPVSGAYTVSAVEYRLPQYDLTQSQLITYVTLEKNPYYKGNYEGVKPQIQKIVYKFANRSSSFDPSNHEENDIINGIVGGAEKDALIEFVENSNGEYGYTSYPAARSGVFAFRCDLGPLQYRNVRTALAWCIDRDGLTKEMTGGYGDVVSAPYCTEEWKYKLSAERGLSIESYGSALEAGAKAASEDGETAFDPDAAAEKAIALLEADGWIYNAKGEAYTDGVRYKKLSANELDETNRKYKTLDGIYKVEAVDGAYYMPLIINAFASVDSVSFYHYSFLCENPAIEKAGMKVVMSEGDMGQLLSELYQSPLYGDCMEDPIFSLFPISTYYAYNIFDYSTAHTIDPEMYDIDSLYFLKDTADVYLVGENNQ